MMKSTMAKLSNTYVINSKLYVTPTKKILTTLRLD